MDPANVKKYTWVDLEILGASYVLSEHVVVSATKIIIGRPHDWSVLPMKSGKRICNIFKGCTILFYECMFTQINVWIPLYEFEVDVLKSFMIAPSRLNLVFGLL